MRADRSHGRSNEDKVVYSAQFFNRSRPAWLASTVSHPSSDTTAVSKDAHFKN